MPSMKNRAYILIHIFLLILPYFATGQTEEEIDIIGFGIQPAFINPQMSNDILTKRVLSATKYKLTPGDTYKLIIQLETKQEIPLILHDNYKLEIPYIGTIDVHGMFFSDLRDYIINTIKVRLPVEYVDFILTSPALFDVFVFGGVVNPGIATVTPITRVTDALALVKGLKEGGSYRQIVLYRGEEEIICDLTKFVLLADESQNPILEPGDKIYVPHAEIIVHISGSLRYPDYYEMIPGETLQDVINIAGGLLPNAKEDIEIARINEDGTSSLLTVSLEEADQFTLTNGDRINVRSVFENREMIFLEATLFGEPSKGDEPQMIPIQPIVANIPYVPGLTLYQLLDKLGGPTPLADSENSMIIRNDGAERIPVDVKTLWETGDPSLDIVLQPGDHVFIPMKLMKVFVSGEVNKPGAYNYFTGATVADYIALAGGVNLSTANPNRIFLVDENYDKEKIKDLNMEVQPGDVIFVDKTALDRTYDKLTKLMIFLTITSVTATILSTLADFVNDFRAYLKNR
jgi:polysaccharide export outer membrane protein